MTDGAYNMGLKYKKKLNIKMRIDCLRSEYEMSTDKRINQVMRRNTRVL